MLGKIFITVTEFFTYIGVFLVGFNIFEFKKVYNLEGGILGWTGELEEL